MPLERLYASFVCQERLRFGSANIFFLGRARVLLLWRAVAQLVDFVYCLQLISWAEHVSFFTYCAIRIPRMGNARITLIWH